MAVFLIPVQNVPQKFSIELGGIGYIITTRWNTEAGAWALDIADEASGTALITNLPIVTGIDLLAQYQHIISGSLVAYTEGNEYAPPNLDNFGREGNLFFVK